MIKTIRHPKVVTSLRLFSRNVLVGISMFMILVSVASFFAMFFVVKSPDQSQVHVEKIAMNAAKNRCSMSAKNIGFSAIAAGSHIQLFADGPVKTTENAFALSTALLSDCPGYQLDKFCAGSSCKHSIDMTLSFKGG